MKKWTLILVHIWSSSCFELQSWTPFISLVHRLGTAFHLVLPSSNAARETLTFVGRFQTETSTYIFLWNNIFAQQIISRWLSSTWSSLKISHKISALTTLLLTENTAKNRVITEFNLLVMESQCYIHRVVEYHYLKQLNGWKVFLTPSNCGRRKKTGPQRAQIPQREAQKAPCWCWSVTLQHKVHNDALTSYLKPGKLSGYLH